MQKFGIVPRSLAFKRNVPEFQGMGLYASDATGSRSISRPGLPIQGAMANWGLRGPCSNFTGVSMVNGDVIYAPAAAIYRNLISNYT